MTSRPAITGAVARGAAPLLDYRCTSCGREFSGDAPFIRWAGHKLPGSAAHCAGVVVLDVVRGDRAGVAVPTAIQPVGGDQLVAGGPGELLGEAEAVGDRGHETSIATAEVERSVLVHAPDARGRMHAGLLGGVR